MDRFTFFCTEEQTKKALELGAPIEKVCHSLTKEWENKIPTTEQMIGWLEEHKVFVQIDPILGVCCGWYISSKGYNKYGYAFKIKVCKTRKEATLAAIDAALEYLTNNKQKEYGNESRKVND